METCLLRVVMMAEHWWLVVWRVYVERRQRRPRPPLRRLRTTASIRLHQQVQGAQTCCLLTFNLLLFLFFVAAVNKCIDLTWIEPLLRTLCKKLF